VLVFAYGSNLSRKQMRERCPSAVRGPLAYLPGHALVFGGHSYRWGGAVANVVRKAGAAVPGLIYQISRDDVGVLDRYEGHPFAYTRVERIVVDERCRRRRVHLYVQPEEDFVQWLPAPRYFAELCRSYNRLGLDRRLLATALQTVA